MKPKTPVLYGSFILLQCLFWGVGNPVIKICFEHIPVFWCLMLRFALSFFIFAVFFFRRVFLNFKREHAIPCLIISSFTAGAFIMCNLALRYTYATSAGFLMSLAVLFTPFLSCVFLKKHFSAKHLIPVIIVVIGLYFFSGGGFFFGIGELFALLGSVFLAFALIFSEKYLENIDPMIISASQSLTTAIFCAVFAFCLEPAPNLKTVPFDSWAMLAYLVICCTVLAYVLQNAALKNISADYVSLLSASEPVFTTIASYIILGETLNAYSVTGAALIVSSILLASIFQTKQKNIFTAKNNN